MNCSEKSEFSLCGSTMCVVLLISTLIATVPPATAQENPAPLTRYQVMARDTLEQLVEINTTDSVGNTTEAAEAMAERLVAAK